MSGKYVCPNSFRLGGLLYRKKINFLLIINKDFLINRILQKGYKQFSKDSEIATYFDSATLTPLPSDCHGYQSSYLIQSRFQSAISGIWLSQRNFNYQVALREVTSHPAPLDAATAPAHYHSSSSRLGFLSADIATSISYGTIITDICY